MSGPDGLRVLLVAADRVAVLTVPGDENDQLAALQALVGGQIDLVAPPRPRDWHAWVNEEGLLWRLPVNGPASRLARAAGWPGDSPLVGPVVFVGDDGGEDDTDVPARLVDLAQRMRSRT